VYYVPHVQGEAMSSGWAWKCEKCGSIELEEYYDALQRPRPRGPVGWSAVMVFGHDLERDVISHFCVSCTLGMSS
jgi:hypothetical protein